MPALAPGRVLAGAAAVSRAAAAGETGCWKVACDVLARLTAGARLTLAPTSRAYIFRISILLMLGGSHPISRCKHASPGKFAGSVPRLEPRRFVQRFRRGGAAFVARSANPAAG